MNIVIDRFTECLGMSDKPSSTLRDWNPFNPFVGNLLKVPITWRINVTCEQILQPERASEIVWCWFCDDGSVGRVCKSFTRICVYAFIYVCMRTCISKGWNVVVAHHFRFPFLQTPTSYSLSGGPIIKLFYAYVCALPANRNFSDSVVGVSLHHVAVYAYMLLIHMLLILFASAFLFSSHFRGEW